MVPSSDEAASQVSVQLENLKSEVSAFAEKFIPPLDNWNPNGTKVIHDGLWGTLRLDAHEVAFLDTPLLQRLRQIHQTGGSFLTYPSTTHTRFEHTLGVMLQIEKLGEAILHQKDQRRLSDEDITEMRLAALLHDIGHGPFSHTSEMIYGDDVGLQEFRKVHPDASPHEALAYLILTSKPFETFAQSIADAAQSKPFPLQNIASYIVGDIPDKKLQYKGELLNGPFDADKLDYIFRDSRFSGLPLAADLDRLWYTVRIAKVGDANRLVATQSGATALEQVFFAKMVLFSTVYQHHKVRACDCMFAGIIEYMRNKGIQIPVNDKLVDFQSAADFLWLTDAVLLSYGFETKDEDLHTLIHDLYFRRLLKRAVIISRKTRKEKDDDAFDELLALSKSSVKRRQLAKVIWEKAGKPCLKEQVFVDIPKQPDFVAAESTYIFHSDPPDEKIAAPITLNDLLNLGSWTKQYEMHRWRGHVFCPPRCRDKIAAAAKEVLQEKYYIEILPEAFSWCKVTPP